MALTAIILLVACKSETKQGKSTTVENEPKQEAAKSSNSSSDYSSLFNTYTCNVSSAELAKILKIPESDITVLDSKSADNCVFQLKGFGAGHDNKGTTLRLRPVPSSKKQSKKEIASYLKDKTELPSGILMGRDILLAEADDCYIAFQPRAGTALILNENYDSFFVITYQTKASVKGRTNEQHDELKIKAKDLANYLVTKHKN